MPAGPHRRFPERPSRGGRAPGALKLDQQRRQDPEDDPAMLPQPRPDRAEEPRGDGQQHTRHRRGHGRADSAGGEEEQPQAERADQRRGDFLEPEMHPGPIEISAANPGHGGDRRCEEDDPRRIGRVDPAPLRLETLEDLASPVAEAPGLVREIKFIEGPVAFPHQAHRRGDDRARVDGPFDGAIRDVEQEDRNGHEPDGCHPGHGTSPRENASMASRCLRNASRRRFRKVGATRARSPGSKRPSSGHRA